jgi:hypothetical protein
MRIFAAFSFVVLCAATANAQALGYGVAGPATTMGFVSHSRITFNAAGGGEVVAADAIGVGGEFGFFNRLIVGSANATVHLGGVADTKFSPFVTAGYSRLGIGDGEGAFSAFNVGGGFHYWATDHLGFRAELRDHVRPDDRGATHYWSVRLGIAFR